MASHQDIAKETNARFWITTFYKPGVPLSSEDSADKLMAKQWLRIYHELLHRNAMGSLRLIHKHQSLAERLNNAIAAYQVESTTNVNDPRYEEARAAKSQALNEAALWYEMLVGSRPV